MKLPNVLVYLFCSILMSLTACDESNRPDCNCEGPTTMYEYKGKQHKLTLVTNKAYLLVTHPEILSDLPEGIVLEREPEKVPPAIGNPVNEADVKRFNGYYFAILKGNIAKLDLSKPGILYRGPYYLDEENDLVCATHLLFVKLKKSEDLPKLQKVAKMKGINVLIQHPSMPLWYELGVENPRMLPMVSIANEMNKSQEFDIVEVAFMGDKPLDLYPFPAIK